MPRNFIDQQNQRQPPANGAFYLIVLIFEANQIEIQQEQKCQRRQMSRAKQLEGGAWVITCKEFFPEVRHGQILQLKSNLWGAIAVIVTCGKQSPPSGRGLIRRLGLDTGFAGNAQPYSTSGSSQ
jgi:hypothetical protein